MHLEPLAFLSPFIKPAVEILLTLFLKPSNVKNRLNTIEAYCVYYPVYKGIQRLGIQKYELLEGLIACLREDPAIFVRLLPLIGHIGPSRSTISPEVNELFKRNSNLLYLPQPFFKELDVTAEINRIENLIKQKELEKALKVAEENFKMKYERGDIQAPGVEEVIEEVLILLSAILIIGKKPNYALAKIAAEYYYATLVIERYLERLPSIVTTILYSLLPFEMSSTTLEQLWKVQQILPSSQKIMQSPYIIQTLQIGGSVLGFGYSEFKKAFEEAEHLLRIG